MNDLLMNQFTSPQVNAYYTPTKNQIVFPAGILQMPFFSLQVRAHRYGFEILPIGLVNLVLVANTLVDLVHQTSHIIFSKLGFKFSSTL